MNKRTFITTPTNFLVKLTGILLFLFAIVSIVQGIYSLRVSLNWGRFGITLKVMENKKSILITRVLPGSNAEQAGLKKGDRILQINGQNINEKDVDTIWGDSLAGSQMKITVKRGKQQLEIEMTRNLLPLIERLIRLIFMFVLPVLMIGYILVGLWGLFKQPSFVTKIIALVCFSFGSITAVVNLGSVTSPLTKYLNYYDLKSYIGGISMFLAPAIWIFLFVNFPQKVKFYKTHKFLTLFLIFFIPLVSILLTFLYPKILQNFKYTLHVYSVFMFTLIIFGIVILSRGAKKEQSILKKRQYNLMFFGIKYGAISILFGFLCLIVYSAFMSHWAEYFGWAAFIIFLVTQVIGLILPFTFLNSFFQNKILETEGALKRKLRYLVSTFTLFLVYLIIAFLIGKWIISRYQLTDPSFIVLLILLLSLTFSPINSKILRWLEQKLYPEKSRYKKSLKKFIQNMSSFIEESQILDNLTKWISKTMGINPVYAISIDEIARLNIPLQLNSRKSVLRKTRDGSNFFWDEIQDELKSQINEKERNWARKNNISITIPMISQGEQMGLLNIGKKKNRNDFSVDDLDIFQEAAHHTALSIQNIKLQAEHLKKKRLEKELEVARDIQAKLMPRKIPHIKDLQIHGEYRPCFEVGGDYFDVILIDPEKTALVIADVSGKGAGAALLMSNLQASLKMAISVSLPITEITFRINNMICENTLSTQFITFVICIWNSKTKNLEYVNAGHIPPLIITPTNKIKKLIRTGNGLGIKINQKYKSRKIQLSLNDLLAIYTDGIEDLFDSQYNPFGYDGLKQILLEEKKCHPVDIIKTLMEELKAHAPVPKYCDDITIIIAKRIR